MEELEKSFKKYKKIKQIGDKTVYIYDIEPEIKDSIRIYIWLNDDLIMSAVFNKLCNSNIAEKMIESIEVKK